MIFPRQVPQILKQVLSYANIVTSVMPVPSPYLANTQEEQSYFPWGFLDTSEQCPLCTVTGRHQAFVFLLQIAV